MHSTQLHMHSTSDSDVGTLLALVHSVVKCYDTSGHCMLLLHENVVVASA